MGYPFDYNLLGVPSWLWHYGVPSHYDIMRNPEDNEINKGKPLWPWSYRGTLTTMTLRGTVMTLTVTLTVIIWGFPHDYETIVYPHDNEIMADP